MNLYVSRNGERLGPHPLQEVNRLLSTGAISPTDLAWHEGLSTWRPLHTIEGIEADPADIPPPLPPNSARLIDADPAHNPGRSGDSSPAGRGRNVLFLILMAFVWTIVIWVASLFLAGMVAGIMNPENAEQAGAALGEKLGGPMLLVALLISIGLSIAGKLPGTGRR